MIHHKRTANFLLGAAAPAITDCELVQLSSRLRRSASWSDLRDVFASIKPVFEREIARRQVEFAELGAAGVANDAHYRKVILDLRFASLQVSGILKDIDQKINYEEFCGNFSGRKNDIPDIQVKYTF